MKCLWNMTGGRVAQFLVANSVACGAVAAAAGAVLKAAGCFAGMGMTEVIVLFAGYGAFAVGLIGGEVFTLRK